MSQGSEMLSAATRLVDEPLPATDGFWSRAAAILIRQALEGSLDEFLAEHAPGSQHATFKAQLIVLRILHPDAALAGRVGYTWAALSRATHHQGYELPPTATTLRSWLATVRTFTTSTKAVE